MRRSYLFAPEHNEKLLTKVFDAGADTVILDLEDAVPPAAKDTARELVSHALTVHRRQQGAAGLCAIPPRRRRPHRRHRAADRQRLPTHQ
jgi:citrate lyase beta subunit